ncbi:DUF3800 domain-containing protein [Maritalea sp. S77]|uniref:DUF3800 domain-containing protein n=1 Tax=Maritalea sp. S77 TaxID=3415125 RepID=UPI003C79F609
MNKICIDQPYAFFVDESGITKDRFTVVGGVCVAKEGAKVAYNSIQKYRDKFGMHAELKWSKVSNHKQIEYEALVDLFFALNNNNRIQFHAIVFDNHTWNHKEFNGGDRDVGLSKLYYQLVYHQFVKRCYSRGNLSVCLDRRNSSTSLHDFRRMINAQAKKDFGIHHDPLSVLVAQDSKKDDLLQLNDVILGAVCAARNGRHLLAGGKSSKREIANKVLTSSGLTDFSVNSMPKVNRFTIWNFQSAHKKSRAD